MSRVTRIFALVLMVWAVGLYAFKIYDQATYFMAQAAFMAAMENWR